MNWLGVGWIARFSVILVNVWYGAPFFLIMYLAALKSVPEQLYEAASIDGANAWQKFRHITLPMMRNIIAITVLFSLIVTFANFDIVRVLTAGGPVDQTHVFATLGVQGRHRKRRHPAGRGGIAVHVPDPGVRGLLRPAWRDPAQESRPDERATREPTGAGACRCRGAPSQQRRAIGRPPQGAWSGPTYSSGMFVVMFLMPPFYTLMTTLKTTAEISASASPWWICGAPDAGELSA